MIALPPIITPPAPFPLIVSQAVSSEFVAPGVVRADYRLMTDAGPVVIHVVEVDPHEPTVQIRALLAHDRLVSSGETVSSMAQRSGAVAGINADYFDIGQTNQPLNLVASDGALLRTPSKRVGIAIGNDASVRIGPFGFHGTVRWGTSTLALTGINEWPPQAGASFLTPEYGALPAGAANVAVASLQALDTTPGAPGSYRLTALGPWPGGPITAPLLAFGPAAQGMVASLPAVDDTIQLDFASIPDVRGLAAAVGGGPQLLQNGQPAYDPFAPAPEETNVRFPVAGAAVDAAGDLLFVTVDGRQPAVSVGLTRPQFGALMRGFGATDGLAFDSGGSATLVARVLGNDRATVLNTPSDGVERPVADGLFVFSTAPRGLHPHLVVRPSSFVALPGATLALNAAIVDDAGHKFRDASVPPLVVNPAIGPHSVTVHERGGLAVDVQYSTVAQVASLQVAPDRPNPAPGGTVALSATAFDANGNLIVLGNDVTWRATSGSISGTGAGAVFHAGANDATVSVSAAGASTSVNVAVGSQIVPIPGFMDAGWHFATLPGRGPGALAVFGKPQQLAVRYDFTNGERAAYARANVVLPGDPLEFHIEVFGDGLGEALRASFVNRFGELHLLTLAAHVDWHGWRDISVPLPPSLNPPATLTALYLLPSITGPKALVAGKVQFRNASVRVRGSSSL